MNDNIMLLLFSHQLTEDQIAEAEQVLEVRRFVSLPENLQKLWSSVPADRELSVEQIKLFTDFLQEHKRKGNNYVLVQGEVGLSFKIIAWCLEEGFIPIYSTTKRVYNSVPQEDGSIKNEHIFKHVRFKLYKYK